jgi:hypothetical protein
MRAKDLMMREEITITAEITVYERFILLIEPLTRGLPVAGDTNYWVDFVKHLNIEARQSLTRFIDLWNIDRLPEPHKSGRTGEGR